MFTAKDKNGKRINILSLIHNSNLEDFDDSGCTCPLCDEPVKMRAKDSEYMRPHFFHLNNAAHGGGESEAHREIKANLYFELIKRDEQRNGVTHDVEYTIYLDDGARRSIDVAVLKDGRIIEAHEIQLSKNSAADFKRRTEEYHSHPDGFTVNWIIRKGGVNDKQDVTSFLLYKCGGYSEAEF